jgi:hypothetical protein
LRTGQAERILRFRLVERIPDERDFGVGRCRERELDVGEIARAAL